MCEPEFKTTLVCFQSLSSWKPAVSQWRGLKSGNILFCPQAWCYPFKLTMFILFAVIKCLENAMDLESHQTAPEGGVQIDKVFSGSSSSFLRLFVTNGPPFILLDASSGVLKATWPVTNVFRGREALGLWSCRNEWPPQGDFIKSPASTLSQEGSFRGLRLKILRASFVLGWEHCLGGHRTRDRRRTSGLVDLEADLTPFLPNWDSEQGA